MLSSAAIVPLIWSGIALVGIVYSFRLLAVYQDNQRAVPLMKRNGIRKRLAIMWTSANLVEERITLFQHACSFAAGIVSLFIPPSSSDVAIIARILISLALVGMNVLGMTRSVYRFRKWKEWDTVVLAPQAPKDQAPKPVAPPTRTLPDIQTTIDVPAQTLNVETGGTDETGTARK